MKKPYGELATILVYKTSVWGASKIDREVSDEVTQSKGANRKSGTFTKHLLARECPQLTAIQNHVQYFQKWVQIATFPVSHLGRGSAIVPNVKVLEIAQQCRKYQVEFYNLVNQFLADYDSIVMEAKTKLAQLADDDYPTKEQIKKKFSFEFGFSPIPDGSQFERKLGITELESMLSEKYEEQLNETFAEGEDALRNQLRARLLKMYEALVNYSESDRGRGKGVALSERVLVNIQDDLTNINSLNLRKKTDIRDWCNRASLILNKNGRELRSNATVRRSTINDLGHLLQDMGVALPDRPQEPAISYADLFNN